MEHVRLATLADAEEIAAIYAPFVEKTHVSFEEVAPLPGAMSERLIAALDTMPWIVCERNGRVAGYAYASAHRSRAAYRFSVDTSAYVADGDRGTGVGRATYAALIRVLIAQRFANAFAGIALPNDTSLALHRALGFDEVGRYRNVGFKNEAWRDTVWLQRSLAPRTVPPLEPLALGELSAETIARALT
jgi:L-amino acid N-acyltransferase YncA